ncbi:hypothetical protein F4820DRAFT_426504 [Hypoxylon rubiginosum]|uniref:Uncharacterized protein n=1 Tax=Hypoxylon rubiginosum TaxID=110542 RepID=A0ACB9YVV3_9PEZI|nr:hypothetical protein F4820DRAFT_426504 [Hypoxylon rubiginosum]
MPTFVTRETYSCSHSSETRHRTFGNDGNVIIDTIPIPLRCLACTCQALSYTISLFYGKGVDNLKLSTTVLSHIRELSSHLDQIITDRQWRTTTGTCNTTYGLDMNVVRDLEILRHKIQMPADLYELRTALYALSILFKTGFSGVW